MFLCKIEYYIFGLAHVQFHFLLFCPIVYLLQVALRFQIFCSYYLAVWWYLLSDIVCWKPIFSKLIISKKRQIIYKLKTFTFFYKLSIIIWLISIFPYAKTCAFRPPPFGGTIFLSILFAYPFLENSYKHRTKCWSHPIHNKRLNSQFWALPWEGLLPINQGSQYSNSFIFWIFVQWL